MASRELRNLLGDKKFRRKTVIVQGNRPPIRPEIIYRRATDSLINSMSGQINSEILPLLKSRESEFVTDSVESDIISVVKQLSKSFLNIIPFATQTARKHAQSVESFHKRAFRENYKRALGVDVDSILDDEGLKQILDTALKDNVRLISSIPTEYFARVENIVKQGVSQGATVNEIQRQLFTKGKDAKTIGVLGITTRRARLIARDQTNKLNGNLTQLRQQGLGITHYTWRSVEDKRVRPLHMEINGNVYAWQGDPEPPEDPAYGGHLHPGQPIQCRCHAEGHVTF